VLNDQKRWFVPRADGDEEDLHDGDVRAALVATRRPSRHSARPFPVPVGILHINENGARSNDIAASQVADDPGSPINRMLPASRCPAKPPNIRARRIATPRALPRILTL
jgi:hypothetical protein